MPRCFSNKYKDISLSVLSDKASVFCSRFNLNINLVDLREHRCPMALLLAKRVSDRLLFGETLTLVLADRVSERDIFHFLIQNGFRVILEKDNEITHFHIEKIKR